MTKIGTKTASKGKKSVTLDVYDCDNVLTFADVKRNYYKIVHIADFDKAMCRFYEWTLQMHNIKTDLTIYNNN